MKINFYNKSETSLSTEELNTLYDATGGNRSNQRSLSKTQAVLDLSSFYYYARSGEQLVGFGRLITDPYFAIILDLCTHPDYRRLGIATEILKRLIEYCRSESLPVQLIDGSGCSRLYEKMGFKQANSEKEKVMYLT